MEPDRDGFRDATRERPPLRRAVTAVAWALHLAALTYALGAVLLLPVWLADLAGVGSARRWPLLEAGLPCLVWCVIGPRRRIAARTAALALALLLCVTASPAVPEAWLAMTTCAVALVWLARR
jgi:hypothetical protein